jgi:hypothetical protein
MHGVCLEEVSHLMTPKAGPSTQKSHHCDICGPVLKGILHLASPLVQKLYMTRACMSTPQKHHTAGEEDTLRSPFEKHCKFFLSVKWFNFTDI